MFSGLKPALKEPSFVKCFLSGGLTIDPSSNLYTAKNDQVVAILMKTGFNNVVRPTLFTVVNNIEQYCYTRFRLNNIVQCVNNVGRTTLFNPVEQRAHNFYACRLLS